MIISEWQKWFGDYSYFNVTVPEGYKLVEDDEHKRVRIEKQLAEYKKLLSYHESQITKLVESIEDEERAILELTK